ncbi:MAG TPA: hypothetical protein VD772_01195, partial [Anseongella sp.]|nr:hypothetical protein [Anseongella sp.]
MNKFLRQLFGAGLLILSILPKLAAQVQSTANTLNYEVMAPSPTTSGLGRYGEVPVSLFTGIPEISVPIYEIKTRQLSLPVSLSYHAAGLRVEEMASWVGLNWSLNAGGVITRTVRGWPDDHYPKGILNNSLPQDLMNQPPLFYKQVMQG